MLRKLFYFLSPKARYLARKIWYLPYDLLSKKQAMIPPKGNNYVGYGNFTDIGNTIVNLFLHYKCINPSDRVLDIGCGIGRVAVPLTKIINSTGSYEGFDIVKTGINWCKKNISVRYPNFQFKYIPLQNDLYNLSTNELAEHLKFPYKNSEFDFVFLTSVFTHMLPKDVTNYINEIHRVLKPGGKCYANFFMLDELEEVNITKHDKVFKFPRGSYWLFNTNVKEANVAYKKAYIINQIERLFTVQTVTNGYWKNDVEQLSHNDYQDIIIFRKQI